MPKPELLSLANISKGGAIEAFDEELVKVLENILDPNYPATKARSITLKVNIIPTAERDMGAINYTVSHSRPARESSTSTVTIGKQDGKAAAANVAAGFNPGQGKLPTEDGKVVNIGPQ